MFEGKILQPGLQDEAVDGADAGETLRPLNWHELSARLCAARDFRRIVGGGAGAASFNPSSARHLALLGTALGDGKPGINPFDLSDGKMTTSMGLATSETASEDRGRA
jgi:hypothetical protein